MGRSVVSPNWCENSVYMQCNEDLLELTKSGDVSGVTAGLLEHSQYIDVDHQDTAGATALYYAAASGFTEIAEILIKCNADVNKPDNCNCTPLSVAAANGFLDVVDLLIVFNANVNVPDNFGSTSLILACMNANLHPCQAEVVNLLINAKAEVNSIDRDGNGSLHYAIEHSHFDIVKLLVDADADVNMMDKYGNTPILWASIKGSEVIVELLLNCENIDIERDNKYGEKPLDVTDKPEIKALFEKHSYNKR